LQKAITLSEKLLNRIEIEFLPWLEQELRSDKSAIIKEKQKLEFHSDLHRTKRMSIPSIVPINTAQHGSKLCS
jgi:hypothetical protein